MCIEALAILLASGTLQEHPAYFSMSSAEKVKSDSSSSFLLSSLLPV